MGYGRYRTAGNGPYSGADYATTTPHADPDAYDDLASAVASLSRDDLAGLPEALNAADAWDVGDATGPFLVDV